VNEFIGGLHHSRDIYTLPGPLRPIQIDNLDELSHWLRLVSEEIQRQVDAQEDVPNVLFGLHAVLETAVQKLQRWVV
jgi:hypothetical protein